MHEVITDCSYAIGALSPELDIAESLERASSNLAPLRANTGEDISSILLPLKRHVLSDSVHNILSCRPTQADTAGHPEDKKSIFDFEFEFTKNQTSTELIRLVAIENTNGQVVFGFTATEGCKEEMLQQLINNHLRNDLDILVLVNCNISSLSDTMISFLNRIKITGRILVHIKYQSPRQS